MLKFPIGKAGREQRNRLLNLTANSSLRAATIGIKAVLVIALAVWLGPAQLGVYGLIAATITLTTYIYGLDFYTFTIREISTSNLDGVRFRLRDQFLLFAFIYGIGTVILSLVLKGFGLDSTLIVLTAAIAVLQHAALELYRILIRIERTIAASIGLFLRDAAWVPGCLLTWLLTGEIGLQEVLLYWLVGSCFSVAYGCWSLARVLPRAPSRPIDLAWLGRGVATGLRMLVGTLSIRGLFTVDRMILALLAPPEVLGAYVFYTSLCFSFSSLFETGVLPYFWPRLLEAAKQADPVGRDATQRTLFRVCMIGAPTLAGAAVVLGIGFANVLPDDSYLNNLDLLFYVAGATMLLLLSNAPHYRLYADNRDTAIVASNAAAFAGFLVLCGLLALASQPMAVPVALVAACGLLLVVKFAIARRGAAA